jgi:hypothetical protein
MANEDVGVCILITEGASDIRERMSMVVVIIQNRLGDK